MNICDFTYRGEKLSSHRYMICEFDGDGSASPITTDSQRSYSSIPLFGGKFRPIVFSTYEEALVIKLSICKIDAYGKNTVILPKDTSLIKKWLCSPDAYEFRINAPEYTGVFWNGTFNLEEVHFCDECIGFNLTFTADAPFGYKDTVTKTGSVLANGSVVIDDTSDEEGYLYPDVAIKLKSSGDLRITNSFDGRVTVIKNCVTGETINISKYLQIKSDKVAHSLGSDFNYKFIRICNRYKDATNTLTFSLDCDYTITYNPIAKVVI